MSDIAKIIGQRIRNQRVQLGISQEKLSELSGFHPTYIGQLERGEKNATLESIERISLALEVPLSTLFFQLGGSYAADIHITTKNFPLLSYELMDSQDIETQKRLYRILVAIHEYGES